MKLISLDYGRRRIGIAVTDENGEYIKGLPTFDRNSSCDFISTLCGIISGHNPGRIIIGLPLDLNGDDTVMSKEIRLFASELKTRLGIPLSFVDESLSSVEAAGIIMFRKKKERRKKGNVDRIAACLILEAFQKGNTCD
jgi:putative holliday junction resolvase